MFQGKYDTELLLKNNLNHVLFKFNEILCFCTNNSSASVNPIEFYRISIDNS